MVPREVQAVVVSFQRVCSVSLCVTVGDRKANPETDKVLLFVKVDTCAPALTVPPLAVSIAEDVPAHS
jgi:hypothetical protein